MIGNLRSDHVIYLPSSQNPSNEPQKIHQLSLGDAFILDQNCLVSTDLDSRTDGGDSEAMKAEVISSDEDLKRTILERHDFVVTLLCDDPSDLEKIEAKLNRLEIDFVLYCPCLPYNHPYDVIDNFLDQVENERKGDHPFYSSNYSPSLSHF